MGFGAFDPSDLLACILHGALYYLPVLIVTFMVGGAVEGIFAIVRKHDINEGFLVTGLAAVSLSLFLVVWDLGP